MFFWQFLSGAPEREWDMSTAAGRALRDQLAMVYPSISDSTFLHGDTTNEPSWLHAATVRVGNPQEVIMFVSESSNGGGRPTAMAGRILIPRRSCFLCCAELFVTPIPQPLPPQRLKGRRSRDHRSCNVLPATDESKAAKGSKRKPHA